MAEEEVIIVIKKGSDWIGGGLWWWSAFTPEQLQDYVEHRDDRNANGTHVGLLHHQGMKHENDPSMTRWGCKYQARHFIQNLRAQGTKVTIKYGDPVAFVKVEANEEQTKIDKEFEKLQRQLKKDAERGKLRLR